MIRKWRGELQLAGNLQDLFGPHSALFVSQQSRRDVSVIDGRSGIRVAYGRGTLEPMSPTVDHEHVKTLPGRFVETASAELGVPVRDLGSTIWLREDVERGVEADEFYYVQNESTVRGRRHIDLALLTAVDLERFLAMCHELDDSTIVRGFREWVRGCSSSSE